MTDLPFYRCYIDGRWTEGSSSDRLAVLNPANNRIWAEVPACTADDCEMALAAAAGAQRSWGALTAMQRAAHLEALCAKLEGERDHFARLLVLEQGKTLREAEGEVADTIGYMRYAAHSARWLRGEIMPADNPDERLMTFRVPYGVCVAICAYNYPLALIGRKVGPALVTGNTIVIKPHEATPVTASEFCRLAEESGIPDGVINMVTGDGATTGAALVSSPRTRLITLTGSIAAGQRVARLAADNLAALCLELGGKAPFIVMDDADIDAAVDAAAIARFANCGQVCICSEAVMVHERVAAEFTDKLLAKARAVRVGNPMDNPDMGPLATAGARTRIDQLVIDSVAAGAELLMGGGGSEPTGFEGGNWFEPTVLACSGSDLPVVRDEIFGPVLPILQIGSAEEAIALTNARDDGLSAYVWTRDNSAVHHFIDRLETGTVFVNKGISGSFHGYHNGHKRSGIGGEDGPHGLENYMQKRSVYLAY
ncbi:aldehyde dehydrogenase family protein [Sphingopyxis sp. NJF-3]